VQFASNANGKIEAGTSALRLIASGLVARFPSRMPHDLLNASLTITKPYGCIRPSAMLPRPIGLPGATSTSSPSAIANSNSLAKTEKLNDNL
jgi:hypothetical protein